VASEPFILFAARGIDRKRLLGFCKKQGYDPHLELAAPPRKDWSNAGELEMDHEPDPTWLQDYDRNNAGRARQEQESVDEDFEFRPIHTSTPLAADLSLGIWDYKTPQELSREIHRIKRNGRAMSQAIDRMKEVTRRVASPMSKSTAGWLRTLFMCADVDAGEEVGAVSNAKGKKRARSPSVATEEDDEGAAAEGDTEEPEEDVFRAKRHRPATQPSETESEEDELDQCSEVESLAPTQHATQDPIAGPSRVPKVSLCLRMFRSLSWPPPGCRCR
jgi:hypothetical protein